MRRGPLDAWVATTEVLVRELVEDVEWIKDEVEDIPVTLTTHREEIDELKDTLKKVEEHLQGLHDELHAEVEKQGHRIDALDMKSRRIYGGEP